MERKEKYRSRKINASGELELKPIPYSMPEEK